jgi:hypothetical protein
MEDAMGGPCSRWEQMKIYSKFWSVNLKEVDRLEVLDVDGRIIL